MKKKLMLVSLLLSLICVLGALYGCGKTDKKVTFDVKIVIDGAEVRTFEVEKDKTISLPNDLFPAGKTVKLWYSDAGCTQTIDLSAYKVTANVTIYGNLEDINQPPNSFTVTFMSDGAEYDTQSVTDGGKASAPAADPQKTGYTFAGWSADGTNVYNFNTAVTSPLTLTALFNINSYTLSFMLGGDAVLEENVDYGGIFTVASADLSAYAVQYYDIVWYTDSGFTTLAGVTVTITGNTTLYGRYELNEAYAIVTFVVDTASDDVIVEKGQLVAKPADPYMEDFAFDYWTLNGIKYNFNEPVTGNITLVAKFAGMCEITFVSEGATYEVAYAAVGRIVAKPLTDPAKSHYTFKFWSKTVGGTEYNFETLVDDDFTLYAVFEINTYTVTFLVNGAAFDSQSIVYGNIAAEPSGTPALSGYRFLGTWTLDATADETAAVYSFATTVSGNITLRAMFIQQFTVEFRNSNTANNSTGRVGSIVTVDKGSPIPAPTATPSRSGYSWLGEWTTTTTGSGSSMYGTASGIVNPATYTVTANVTFWAMWRQDRTITFNINSNPATSTGNGINNASGGPANATVADTQKITRPSEVPIRTGYTFVDWVTTNTATVGSYTAFDFNTYVVSAAVTIYALWSPIMHDVTFLYEKNGSEYTVVPAREAWVVAKPANPEKAPDAGGHYLFEKWMNAADDSEYVFSTTISGPITLYAAYVTAYKVEFMLGGVAINEETQMVKSGELATEPVVGAYRLEGIKLSGVSYDFATPVNSNLQLTVDAQIYVFRVSFNLNSGSGTAPTQVIDSGSYAAAPADPTRSSYRFDGWRVGSATGTLFVFGTTAIIADVSLFAAWVQTYTVTYNVNSGEGSNWTQIVDRSTPFALTSIVPIRAGYEFKWWATASNGNTQYTANTTGITANVTVYAGWTAKNWTLTYLDDQNGSVFTTASTVGNNAYASAPSSVPTKAGSLFDYWALDGEVTAFNFAGTRITQDLTLYAVWKTSYVITVEADGVIKTYEEKVGETFTLNPLDFYRLGYSITFYEEDTFVNVITSFTVSANKNIYGKYQAQDMYFNAYFAEFGYFNDISLELKTNGTYKLTFDYMYDVNPIIYTGTFAVVSDTLVLSYNSSALITFNITVINGKAVLNGGTIEIAGVTHGFDLCEAGAAWTVTGFNIVSLNGDIVLATSSLTLRADGTFSLIIRPGTNNWNGTYVIANPYLLYLNIAGGSDKILLGVQRDIATNKLKLTTVIDYNGTAYGVSMTQPGFNQAAVVTTLNYEATGDYPNNFIFASQSKLELRADGTVTMTLLTESRRILNLASGNNNKPNEMMYFYRDGFYEFSMDGTKLTIYFADGIQVYDVIRDGDNRLGLKIASYTAPIAEPGGIDPNNAKPMTFTDLCFYEAGHTNKIVKNTTPATRMVRINMASNLTVQIVLTIQAASSYLALYDDGTFELNVNASVILVGAGGIINLRGWFELLVDGAGKVNGIVLNYFGDYGMQSILLTVTVTASNSTTITFPNDVATLTFSNNNDGSANNNNSPWSAQTYYDSLQQP